MFNLGLESPFFQRGTQLRLFIFSFSTVFPTPAAAGPRTAIPFHSIPFHSTAPRPPLQLRGPGLLTRGAGSVWKKGGGVATPLGSKRDEVLGATRSGGVRAGETWRNCRVFDVGERNKAEKFRIHSGRKTSKIGVVAFGAGHAGRPASSFASFLQYGVAATNNQAALTQKRLQQVKRTNAWAGPAVFSPPKTAIPNGRNEAHE